jgi:hypothetical protein
MNLWLLAIHNLVRWAVLLSGAYSFLRASTGLLARGGWLPADQKAARIYPIVLDVQVVLGLATWFALHPPVPPHASAAVVALVMAHAGTIYAKRTKTVRTKFQAVALLHGLSLLLIAVRLDWSAPLIPHF